MIKIIKHTNDINTSIIYIENIIDDKEIFKYLDNMDDFEGGEAYTPRLQKWYQKDNEYFSKKWKNQTYPRWTSKDYDEYLLDLQYKIQLIVNKYVSTTFNSCLINKYRDGNDVIKPHRDAIESFGEYPVIANLSIGSERIIRFENKDNTFAIKLKSGSLLIMSGSSQKYFKHSIPKSDSEGVRYSLTFRNYK